MRSARCSVKVRSAECGCEWVVLSAGAECGSWSEKKKGGDKRPLNLFGEASYRFFAFLAFLAAFFAFFAMV